MDEENKSQRESAAGTVRAAAKTGKMISNIAKGAATGGMHGAALGAAKSGKKWILGIVAVVILLPVIILAMLPSIIFGSIFGDGTDTPSGITDDAALTANMTAMSTEVSAILSEGLVEVLAQIDTDFASSGCDEKEVNNPYGADVAYNANAFISMYCASKNTDVAGITPADMAAVIRSHKDQLYSYSYSDVTRKVEVPPATEGAEPTERDITVRVYTISYRGEAYFADAVFTLNDDQKALADNYAQNLSVLLSDGMYQGLSDAEFGVSGLSYDGVVFTDGYTQVTYYNQLDDRWKNSPYGTDHIGGYACGPTAMAIVVSSLTSETIDPPHMSQWAYRQTLKLTVKEREHDSLQLDVYQCLLSLSTSALQFDPEQLDRGAQAIAAFLEGEGLCVNKTALGGSQSPVEEVSHEG